MHPVGIMQALQTQRSSSLSTGRISGFKRLICFCARRGSFFRRIGRRGVATVDHAHLERETENQIPVGPGWHQLSRFDEWYLLCVISSPGL